MLKVYDYYSSFWDVQNFLGSLRYFYRSSLKSLHFMYFDLYTIMILTFSNSQIWASIGPITLWKNHIVKSIWLLQQFLGCPKYFRIFTVLLQEQPKFFAFYVLWFIYHNDPNFFEQSDLGKHCRPRSNCFWRRGAWSQSALFVIQLAGITLMAKPYCSDLKIITAIVQVPNFSNLCCECGRF